MTDHYGIKWKRTWRKKMYKSDHFRVENYMVWRIRRQEQFSFAIPPALGWQEALPALQRPESSWGIMLSQQQMGFPASSHWCYWGCPTHLSSSLGSPSPLLRWAWATFHWRFLKLEISQTTLKPFLKSCNWISCMILGWYEPRGSRNQTPHNQKVRRLNCTGWGLKDTLF